jgi:hypothetical protein
MIVYIDLISNATICTDSFKPKAVGKGAIVAIETEMVCVNEDNVDIGANPSTEATEGGEEGGDSTTKDEKEKVINLVHSYKLNKGTFNTSDKKDQALIKALFNSYFFALKNKLEKLRLEALGFASDYKVPTDKAEAKKAEEAKLAELSKFEKTAYDAVAKKCETFKTNFPQITEFLSKEIFPNITECDFYFAENCNSTKDSCESMIIPARYVGEATSPTFYFFVDGYNEEKQ